MSDAHSEGYQLVPRPWVEDGEALVAWLRAQFDDDERIADAAARDAGGPAWSAGSGLSESVSLADGGGYVASGPYGYLSDEMRQHIARRDPARALREVQANRRILNECLKEVERETATGRRYPASTAWALAVTTLRLLALPYADRPGYREKWRP